MTATTERAAALPSNDTDAFGHDVLEDPSTFHADLRDAGPVVYLTRHDVYAFGRYEQVHAALVNWQEFQSAAGVGLSNFRNEKPWRPPSLLLEADPPLHDAPRRVLKKILGPRALRRLHDDWVADADELVEDVLAVHGTELDAVSHLAQAFPLRVFPDAVGIPKPGRENLLPYGDHMFNAFGPANDLVAKGAPRACTVVSTPADSSDRTISGACSGVMSPRSAAAQMSAPKPSGASTSRPHCAWSRPRARRRRSAPAAPLCEPPSAATPARTHPSLNRPPSRRVLALGRRSEPWTGDRGGLRASRTAVRRCASPCLSPGRA